MSAHTPGPWDFSRGGLEISGNRLADHIARTLGADSDAEVAANFNLLEAAPELLEASRRLVEGITTWGADDEGSVVREAVIELSRVIKKTERSQ